MSNKARPCNLGEAHGRDWGVEGREREMKKKKEGKEGGRERERQNNLIQYVCLGQSGGWIEEVGCPKPVHYLSSSGKAQGCCRDLGICSPLVCSH